MRERCLIVRVKAAELRGGGGGGGGGGYFKFKGKELIST